MTPRRSPILLCLLLLLGMSGRATGADMSILQATGLSFMDIDTMTASMMKKCETAGLSEADLDMVRSAYRHFRAHHLPHQKTIRDTATRMYQRRGAQGEQTLAYLQDPEVQKSLAGQIVIDKPSRDYCVFVFAPQLGGRMIALNFADHAQKIMQQEATAAAGK